MTAPPARRAIGNGDDQGYVLPTTGEVVPSVTTILKNCPKPVLIPWAAKCAAEYAVSHREELDGLLPDQQVRKIKAAPWESRDKAAHQGDLVHALVEHFVKVTTGEATEASLKREILAAPITAQRAFRHFMTFVADYKPQFICSETTIYNDRFLYAGTLDLMVKVNGVVALVDVKTGKGVYPETCMQVAAYAHADNYAVADNGEFYKLPQANGFAVLQLRPDFGLVHRIPAEYIPVAEKAFLGLRQAYEFFGLPSRKLILEARELAS